MDLKLTRDEATLLTSVLERYISDVRGEIAGTENFTWRKELQADEALAKSMLARLKQAA
jgi:hypothetical protein